MTHHAHRAAYQQRLARRIETKRHAADLARVCLEFLVVTTFIVGVSALAFAVA